MSNWNPVRKRIAQGFAVGVPPCLGNTDSEKAKALVKKSYFLCSCCGDSVSHEDAIANRAKTRTRLDELEKLGLHMTREMLELGYRHRFDSQMCSSCSVNSAEATVTKQYENC
jgi:hypothetical protein